MHVAAKPTPNPRSSGAPTAGHQGPGRRYTVHFRQPGLAACRRRQLSSNVRCLLVDTAMRIVNHANLSTDILADIAKELEPQENLKDMMAWALSRPRGTFLPSVVDEVIVQDEFTHDVIVPWRDGLVLVYDTT